MSCFGFSGTIFWQYQWYIYVKGFNLSLSKDLQSAVDRVKIGLEWRKLSC